MTQHARLRIDTGLAVYFCDPHSPWQRGSNEDSNGLLRQYFPRNAELSIYTRTELNRVARELNNRSRQTLGWMKPFEVFCRSVASIS
jgi:transposase, IS30 family